ncbi:methyltransferase domain-containing protein [Caballeronia insecticola]|uniref:Methylase involved in ubiquinone/menaquinone biosynthesis-like protein n=1 Tax=Caballeronia insecticola TaxID=758793 RepID=A0A060PH14_9BURK|nr:methyltransferase domain-containing protein [Caballeronia insecticola]BAO94072.1 methylase involved in ubiquinone/menaquinone biosynthesis-like protein [Caballeronia insecticola]
MNIRNEYDELIKLLPDDASQGSDMHYVREVLSNAGPLSVVDLGCGPGKSFQQFRAINGEIEWIGIDFEDSAAKRAADLPFKPWDGSTIPLGDASADLVYSHQSLESVRSPDAVMKEIARVLKPGGYLIGSTSQLEPGVSGSLWNFKPLGLKLLVQDAGLTLTQIRPGIDGATLIARAFLGKPQYMSRYFSSESPLNSYIDSQAAKENLSGRKAAMRKIQYCGQFSFKVVKENSVSRGLPIITYHHHLPSDLKEGSRFKNGTVTNTVESFEAQMAWMHENGYESMTLAEFENYMTGRDPRPAGKRVLITFDDGHLSVARYCYEILKRYGCTAVVFLITGKQPEKPVQVLEPDVLQYVSREEMAAQSDVYEYAAHTHNMHSRDEEHRSNLVTFDAQTVAADAAQCRALVDDSRHFCFPFGQYTDSVVDVLVEVGYRYFYTTEKGLAHPNPGKDVHVVKRLNVSPRMNVQQFADLIERSE